MRIAALPCILLLAAFATARAEPPSPSARAEMAKLAPLAGKWRGGAWMDMPDGSRGTSRSEETVEVRLDGRALLIEGVHHDEKTGALVHHANALLAWDDRRQEYRMASVLASGVTGTYSARLEGERLVWMLAGPAGPRRRFTIRVEGDRWLETGEISFDGETWKPFFEMALTRVK
jgi:hypothetical protein